MEHRRNLMPEIPKNAIHIVAICRKYRAFGEGNKVDIVGVTSSILVTPTILFKHLA